MDILNSVPDMTLSEVCRKYGVSRRAVQGYESHKLVSPTGKTNRGHLLYNYIAQARIFKIKHYQDFGFSLKEIEVLFSDDEEIKRTMLEKQREKLISRKAQIEKSIAEIGDILENN